MLNLKSELFEKQKEIKELQSQSSTHKTKVVKACANSSLKKAPSWLKKNAGVEKRNQNDLLDIKEEDKHNQVQAILEAKSKLYNQMTKGDFIPDSEDTQMFLVDFEQKSIDAWRERTEKGNKEVKPKGNVKMSADVMKTIDDVKDQWVEYEDSLGRTRTVLKEDLPRLQKDDESKQVSSETKTLMSNDMRREEERVKWEQSAIEEMQNEVHYENLRFGEIRELGVGYYAFSGKQAERDEQMRRLDEYRRETEKRKQENETKKQKQQSALTARLEKVRQRRIKQLQAQGKEVPASLLEPVKIEQKKDPPSEIKHEAQKTNVETSQQSVSHKTREWDKGKDAWQPAQPPTAPKSWKDPHEERLAEFAPPDFYYDTHEVETPFLKKTKLESPQNVPNIDDNERIERLLAEIGSSETATQETAIDEPSTSQPSCNISTPSLELLDRVVSTEAEEKSGTIETVAPSVPYVPTAKPISMKLMSKPTKLLNTKSALD